MPVLAQVKGDPDIMKYLPVYSEAQEPPDRRFFFAVLGSLEPDYLSNLIKHANRARNKEEQVQATDDTIEVRADLFKKLESEPFFSSKTTSSSN